MNLKTLLALHCQEIPPSQGTMSLESIEKYLRCIPDWVQKEKHLERKFTLRNFLLVMEFLNLMARIAEGQQHHPDIFIHYNQITFSLWTHTVGGITINDFIVAAQIDALYERL